MIPSVSVHLTRQAKRAMTLAERRSAHLAALSEPMIGVPFRGEPKVVSNTKLPSPTEWERCRYATAILRQRDPSFAGDLSHLEASLDMFGTVAFRTEVRCRVTTLHPDGLRWVVVALVELAEGDRPSPTLHLRSGGRAAPPALPAPSPAPAITAGQTEGTAP